MKIDKPKMIALTPRFYDKDGSSYFDGYDQIFGTHFFDEKGHVYAFVSLDDYNNLKSNYIEMVAKLLESDDFGVWQAKRNDASEVEQWWGKNLPNGKEFAQWLRENEWKVRE